MFPYCTKYELHLTVEYKIIHEYFCCHGNKVSLATRPFMDVYCPNEQMYQICSFTWLKNTKLFMDVLVAMVTRLSQQQDHLWILIALTNKCTKYELHLTSECKVIDRCPCCHGNKVSIATRSFMDFDCLNKQLYQIWASYDFRMQSYLHARLAYSHTPNKETNNH